jgi:hypothetical protein
MAPDARKRRGRSAAFCFGGAVRDACSSPRRAAGRWSTTAPWRAYRIIAFNVKTFLLQRTVRGDAAESIIVGGV